MQQSWIYITTRGADSQKWREVQDFFFIKKRRHTKGVFKIYRGLNYDLNIWKKIPEKNKVIKTGGEQLPTPFPLKLIPRIVIRTHLIFKIYFHISYKFIINKYMCDYFCLSLDTKFLSYFFVDQFNFVLNIYMYRRKIEVWWMSKFTGEVQNKDV